MKRTAIFFWLVNKLDHGASITQQVCAALKSGNERFGLGILELSDFDINSYVCNSACRQFEFHDRRPPQNRNPTADTRSRYWAKFGNRLILVRESVVIPRYSLVTEGNHRLDKWIRLDMLFFLFEKAWKRNRMVTNTLELTEICVSGNEEV